MAQEKKPAKARKIIDVAHPGKSAPSPNSKSVIITHRPIMKDPMVVVEEGATEPDKVSVTPAPASAAVSRTGGVILPPSTPELPEALQEDIPPEQTDEPKEADNIIPQPEAEDEPEAPLETAEEEIPPTPTPAPARSTTVTKPARLVNDVAKPEVDEAPSAIDGATEAKMGTKGVQSDAEIAAAEDAEAKRQAHLQELVESKKYYLPINTRERQRTKQFVVSGVVLSVLLIAVWVDIALDAGLIQIGHFKALTHFFK